MKTREEQLEERLNLHFKNAGILHKALVHRSYLNENKEEKESNERLEFLGDAVLEFLVSAEIFRKFPELPEGELTAIRSFLVNTEQLATVAGELNLGEALYLSKGEEKEGGRENKSLLANTFEAVLGALFLDQGLESCQELIKKFILTKLPGLQKNLKDPKSLFQEVVQARGLRAPTYKVISENGPDHARTFSVGVFVDGKLIVAEEGKSKQEAEQKAAKAALEKIKKE